MVRPKSSRTVTSWRTTCRHSDRTIFNHEMVYVSPLVRDSGQVLPEHPDMTSLRTSSSCASRTLTASRDDLPQKASSASRTLTASSSKTIFDSLLIKIKKVNQITSVAENVQGHVHQRDDANAATSSSSATSSRRDVISV